MADLVKLHVDLHVTDAVIFDSEVVDGEIASRSDAILVRMIAPAIGPGDAGFEIIDRTLETVSISGMETIRISVEARVFSRSALHGSASEVREDCWGERDWQPKDDEEALLEVLFYSNENPCPSLMGFAFIGDSHGPCPIMVDPLETPSP